jgi:hypothetical protein
MLGTVLENTGHNHFDPDRHWANGFMGVLKMNTNPKLEKCPDFMWCVEYALRIVEELHACPVKYLDELDRAARLACGFYRDGEFITHVSKYNRRPGLQSFLDFAAWACLPSYIRAKAPDWLVGNCSVQNNS